MVNEYNRMLLKIARLEQSNDWLVTGKNPQSSTPKYHDIGQWSSNYNRRKHVFCKPFLEIIHGISVKYTFP